ncbi:hypothetical protein SUNI508_12591 [Seiridium unicorne]|uniref:Uncharacterized protein n=1 Tax=Seiridium unicorne TaxID=138068 RepID=A0ABR2VGR9_9PEZI
MDNTANHADESPDASHRTFLAMVTIASILVNYACLFLLCSPPSPRKGGRNHNTREPAVTVVSLVTIAGMSALYLAVGTEGIVRELYNRKGMMIFGGFANSTAFLLRSARLQRSYGQGIFRRYFLAFWTGFMLQGWLGLVWRAMGFHDA